MEFSLESKPWQIYQFKAQCIVHSTLQAEATAASY
jgi:hypothetical protein